MDFSRLITNRRVFFIFALMSSMFATAVLASEPGPSPTPSTKPLLQLQANQAQYTVGQLAILTAIMAPAEMNPAFNYFLSCQMDSQRIPAMQHAAGNWQSFFPFRTPGKHIWQVELKELGQTQTATFEKQLASYRSHIQLLEKELAESGLSLAEKEALEAQLTQDKAVLRQIQENFEAAMKNIESDSLTLSVIPAPSPSVTPSPKPSPKPSPSPSKGGAQ